MTDQQPDPFNPQHALEQAALAARKQRVRRARLTNGFDDAGLGEVSRTDFYAYMPRHTYIFVPTLEQWPASSVNGRLPPVKLKDGDGKSMLDEEKKPRKLKPSTWLDQNRPVEQMTWAPGEPQIIADRLVSHGGWIERKGVHTFNLYRPPMVKPGNAAAAGPWLKHLQVVYPDDADHICRYFAHRVQHPQEKINHALLFGGKMGIGKDAILEPVKTAVGPWNFREINTQQLLGRFNGFIKSVILRISEARDLGDVNRYQLYDHLKAYTAAPPDVLLCDEKNLREHSVFNVCGVIITTNYKTDGIYLPEDDRRHYVAWSHCDRADFPDDYFPSLFYWYNSGGTEHVCAFLRELDITAFDPKASPPRTPAFWEIVDACRAPENAELEDAIELLRKDDKAPDIVTVSQVASRATPEFASWLNDRKNSRRIPHRFEECGYVAVQNPDRKDNFWKIDGKRQIAYGKAMLTLRDRIAAAQRAAGIR